MPKFEDWSQEETGWQERCAREAAWRLAKSVLKLKEKHKTTFFSPSENWCLPSPSTIKPEEREFVVDSGASMHIISKKDLNSAELETVTTSRSPTTVITANGEVQTLEEAQFMSKNWIYSWRWNSSRIRQQFYRWESFAMNMDTHMSGSTVKNHVSLKTVFAYSATRKTSYQSWFFVYLQLLQARQFQHPRLLQVRKLIIQITIQQSSQVKVWIDKHGETRSLLKHQKSCHMNQPKSQDQIQNEDHEQVRRNPCSDIPEWLQEFRENLVDERVHTRVLLMNHLYNLWEVWTWVSTVFILTSDRNCAISRRTKITRASCRRRTGTVVPRAEQFGWLDHSGSQSFQWRMWISKQSSICNRGARLGYSMDPVVSVQNKNFSGNTKGACKSSWSRIRSLKSFTLTIPWNLARPVKIFRGIIVRQHHTDQKQMWFLREQCAEWKKVRLQYCCNQVWMKNGGQISWNATSICETFKISCLMGRLHTKDVLENLSKDQSSRLVHWLSISLISAKDQLRIHQFGKKVLLGLFLGYALYAGRIWKGDIMVADVEDPGNDGRIGDLLEKTQCKGGDISQRKWKVHFSSRRWTNQIRWRRSGTENVHHDTGTSNSRWRSKRFSWRIRRVSTTTTTRLTSGCQWSTKWFLVHFKKTSFTAITLIPEWNFTRLEKNHSLFHWNTLTTPELRTQTWMLLCKKAASMTIGLSMDQEICLVLGQVSPSLLC